MGPFAQTLTADRRGASGSWPLSMKPISRLDPCWKAPAVPSYHGTHIVGCHHLTWSSMTAVVVDLRSEGHVLAELDADFTRICIALEEVGGIFQISGGQGANQNSPMSRGTISVIPPGSRAHGKANGLTFMRQLFLQVDKRNLIEAFGSQIDVDAALAPRLMVSNTRLWRLGHIIAEECGAGYATSRAYGDSISMAVLSALADTAQRGCEREGARGGLAPWRLTRVVQYLFENIAERLDLETQAAIAGLSKSHYCRAFKTSMGISPHQWLLNARIDKAKQHLLADELPLAEIALVVGFTDQAHFTHTFSKIEGVSPRSWQRARSTPLCERQSRQTSLESLPSLLRQGAIDMHATTPSRHPPAS